MNSFTLMRNTNHLDLLKSELYNQVPTMPLQLPHLSAPMDLTAVDYAPSLRNKIDIHEYKYHPLTTNKMCNECTDMSGHWVIILL